MGGATGVGDELFEFSELFLREFLIAQQLGDKWDGVAAADLGEELLEVSEGDLVAGGESAVEGGAVVGAGEEAFFDQQVETGLHGGIADGSAVVLEASVGVAERERTFGPEHAEEVELSGGDTDGA